MKTIYVNPWGAIIKKQYSHSAIVFLQELENLEYLIFYLLVSDKLWSTHYKDFREQGIKYIRALEPRFKETFDFIVDRKADKLLFISESYERLLSQMIYSRSIDNFILYLKNILAEIIEIKPQLLKSGDKERLDYILSFDDITELRRAIADKKIENLFYSGFKDISDFFESRIGISISDSNEDEEKFVLMTKVRNLIVHNGGKINSEFKNCFPNYPLEVRGLLRFSFNDILNQNTVLLKSVNSIDKKITDKFGLSLNEVKDGS